MKFVFLFGGLVGFGHEVYRRGLFADVVAAEAAEAWQDFRLGGVAKKGGQLIDRQGHDVSSVRG